MATIRRTYWLYDLRVLFKNRVTFWSIVCLTPIIGFLMPKELYELINRGMISGVVRASWLILISVLLISINVLIIRIILLTKYAIKQQSNLAGPILYLVIAMLALAGIWLRLYLEYKIPDTSTLLGPSTATPAVPHLPLSFLPAIISVTITLSLFSTVYGLVSEPYSKVDYSAFHSSLKRFFVSIQEIQNKSSDRPGASLEIKYAANVQDALKETIKQLQSETDKEKDYYLEFINQSIFPLLRRLEEFASMHEFEKNPKLILQLCRSDNKTTPSWIKDQGYLGSFQILQSYLNRSTR